jgi:hypothetical protein
MPEPSLRQQALEGLLLQLSTGLSAYRLFDGDRNQTSYTSAVERIGHAAGRALEFGPVDVEIRGGRFRTEDGPIRENSTVDRLAEACYARRIERLWVRSVPAERELATLYEVLSPVRQAGEGVLRASTSLRAAGVVSLGIAEVSLLSEEIDRQEIDERSLDDPLGVWQRLQYPAQLAAELLSEVTGGLAADQADRVLAQLDSLVASLPQGATENPELYRLLHEVIMQLPRAVRRSIGLRLLERAHDDPVAAHMIDTMTDGDLARLLVDLAAARGTDSQAEVERLIMSGARRPLLYTLAAGILDRQRQGAAGADEGASGVETGHAVARTVSDLLEQGLVGGDEQDLVYLRQHFPSTEEDQRAMALTSLHDYLRVDTDISRIDQVLEAWVHEARGALTRMDRKALETLLEPLEVRASTGGESESAGASQPDVRQRIRAAVDRVATPSVLRQIVVIGGPDTVESVGHLLQPFGVAAVDNLLDVLADEDDRSHRALLIGILAGMTGGYTKVVARRLDDPRWFVARNAVTILARAASPEAAPVLEQASRHAHPGVRKEAVKGLIAVTRAGAIPHLERLVEDPDPGVATAALAGLGQMTVPAAAQSLAAIVRRSRDVAVRRRALAEIAVHPAPDAPALLQDLGSSRSRPKLPRKLRKQATALARHQRTPGGTR